LGRAFPTTHWDRLLFKIACRSKRVMDKARYSLVISISTPGQAVDLYTQIATLVEVKELEVFS
jgi:hypothetical protein